MFLINCLVLIFLNKTRTPITEITRLPLEFLRLEKQTMGEGWGRKATLLRGYVRRLGREGGSASPLLTYAGADRKVSSGPETHPYNCWFNIVLVAFSYPVPPRWPHCVPYLRDGTVTCMSLTTKYRDSRNR